MSNLDSVFANSAEDENEFEAMFDQEDSLIDTVNGVNESGDPLTGVDFEDLHQTQDDEDAKGVKDVESDDQPMGAKNMEGTSEPTPDDNSIKGEENKTSDADDLYKDACPVSYLDGDGANPDENSVNNTIEKEIKESDETIDIDKELDGEEDDPVQDGQTSPVIKEGDEEKNTDIDAELDNEENAVSESSEDIDIDAELDNDAEDAEVDTAVEEEAGEEGGKYSYDPSDEDLIDAAINGNI